MIRPGQLIAAVAVAGFVLCAVGLVFLGCQPHDIGRITTN